MKFNKKPFFTHIFAVLLLAACSLQANAASVTLNFDFAVSVFDASDDFVTTYGISQGDIVTGSATYDDSLLTGVNYETIELSDPGGFTFSIGSLTLDETDDVDCCGFGLPSINFLDGDWQGFSFLADVDVGGVIYEVSFENDFFEVTSFVANELVIQNTNPIPVPAALPLMVSGLLALFGLRRRSQHLAGK